MDSFLHLTTDRQVETLKVISVAGQWRLFLINDKQFVTTFVDTIYLRAKNYVSW
jgi:hypothetical protein